MDCKILVIEDDNTMRHMISDMLSGAGYQVLNAPDAYRAMDLLAKETPDLVLCDLFMPGMDGYEMLKFIREQEGLTDLPVVIVSTASEDWDKRKASLLGANDFLTKPFSRRTLVGIVRRYTESGCTV